MDFVDLDVLLRSNNFVLTTSDYHPSATACRNEAVVWKDDFGPLEVSCVSFDSGNFYRLSLGDEIKVDVMPEDRLALYSRIDVPKVTIDHFLADQVLPRVISQKGEFILHSGAVEIDDYAVLLLGPSGRGKSTLVTSFHEAGWPLMGDDATVISWKRERPLACAVYPSLRLFPDSIDAVVSNLVASETMAHYTSKQRLNLSTSSESVSKQLPVKAIFVLAEPSDKGEITIHRHSTAQACMSILENSFALDPTDSERARGRLSWASKLARKITTFAISYPHDYVRLPEVRETILRQLADIEPID